MDDRATTMTALRQALELELPAAVELRHRLHASPELSGAEHLTAQRVCDAIGDADAVETVAGTGRLIRVGPLGRPAVAVRAELDALPLTERTGAPNASTNGAMHACGHDVHLAAVTALARAARRLCDAGDLPAPLLVILQPREEKPPSGARDIVAAKVLQDHDVHAVIGAHVQPLLSAHTVAATEGAVNASTDEFEIVIEGRGGHGGYPHLTRDPVVALAHVVVALQQVVSRRINPLHPAVLTIGSIHAGSAANVIPDEARAQGTLRLLDVSDRMRVHQEITAIVEQVAGGLGCDGRVRIQDGEPALVNDPLLTAASHAWLAELGLQLAPPLRSCGADDFSHYGDMARILMMFVGVDHAPGAAAPASLHHPTFLPSDDAVRDVGLAMAAGYLAALDASILNTSGTVGP